MDIVTLLDTNVCLYLFSGRIVAPLPIGAHYVSVVTEIELLSFPDITQHERATIERFLSKVSTVGVDQGVVAHAVELRREHRLRVPDAIIGASALALGAILWTHDAKLSKALGNRSHAPPLH